MEDILPIKLLRTFLEVIDSGSMLRASEKIPVTPSAISLQIKNLETIIRSPIFFRDRRKLTLTPTGEILEKYARRLVDLNHEAIELLVNERVSGPVHIGMIDDFARTLLAGTLRQFANLNPDAQVRVRVAGSQELRKLVSANRLDYTLCVSIPSDPNTLCCREVNWFGDPKLLDLPVLPLAVLEEPCLFRNQAVAALKQADIPFEIVVETASVSVLQAAVEARLAVTSRTAAFMGPLDSNRLRLSSLPTLPSMGYALLEAPNAQHDSKNLRKILRAALCDL